MTFIFFFRGGHKGWSILYHPLPIGKPVAIRLTEYVIFDPPLDRVGLNDR
jgi:hypothetical protein